MLFCFLVQNYTSFMKVASSEVTRNFSCVTSYSKKPKMLHHTKFILHLMTDICLKSDNFAS